MSKVEFKVTMEFTGDYPNELIKELMVKVADALYHEYDKGNGFAPDDADDCLTDGVRIQYGDIHLDDRYYVKGKRVTKGFDFGE